MPLYFEHIVGDYLCTAAEQKARDLPHFREWATCIYKIPEENADNHPAYLEQIDYSIHFHTFRLHSFLEILRYMENELHVPFEIKAYADPLEGSNEFLMILF